MQGEHPPGRLYDVTITLDDGEPERFWIPADELLPVGSNDAIKRAVQQSIAAADPGARSSVPWRPIATSKEEYIAVAEDPDYVRGLTTPRFTNPNLLGFKNGGGIGGEGVCWWHSRFTRAALYLAYFVPDAPRPDAHALRRILRGLMAADEVVAIPGYRTMEEFSRDKQAEIQQRLERAQILEGIFQFCWVNGLAGLTKVSPEHMKALMDKIYVAVRDDGISYVKLQCPGIASHAWLMTAMEPRPDGGYHCWFLDSNWVGTSPWTYKLGMTALWGELGVPYLQREQELVQIKQTIRRFIGQQTR